MRTPARRVNRANIPSPGKQTGPSAARRALSGPICPCLICTMGAHISRGQVLVLPAFANLRSFRICETAPGLSCEGPCRTFSPLAPEAKPMQIHIVDTDEKPARRTMVAVRTAADFPRVESLRLRLLTASSAAAMPDLGMRD